MEVEAVDEEQRTENRAIAETGKQEALRKTKQKWAEGQEERPNRVVSFKTREGRVSIKIVVNSFKCCEDAIRNKDDDFPLDLATIRLQGTKGFSVMLGAEIILK